MDERTIELDSSRDIEKVFSTEIRKEGREVIHAGSGKPLGTIEEMEGGRARLKLNETGRDYVDANSEYR